MRPAPQPGPSLLQRLAAARPRALPRAGRADIPTRSAPWQGPLVRLATLLLLPPLLTIAIALALAAHADRVAARLRHATAPARLSRLAATQAAARRPALARALSRPTIGTTLGRLAALLPRDDALTMIADRDGRLAIAVDTTDPGRLRAALAGDRWGASLRTIGEAPGDDGVRVTLETAGR